MVNFSFSLLSTLIRLITVPLEIGFGQSSVNVQYLEHLQLRQQPRQPPLLLRQQPPLLQLPPQLQPHNLKFRELPANFNSLATCLFHWKLFFP